jgi:hypothetical protein
MDVDKKLLTKQLLKDHTCLTCIHYFEPHDYIGPTWCTRQKANPVPGLDFKDADRTSCEQWSEIVEKDKPPWEWEEASNADDYIDTIISAIKEL